MTKENKKEKILLAANVDEEVIKKIDQLAEETNRSRSGMVITIIKEYFKKYTK